MKSLTIFFKSLLHLFSPYFCCGCGTDLLAEDILFCLWCQACMPITRFEVFAENPIEKIFWGRVDIEAATAHFYFTSGSAIQRSLHMLKYKGKKEIGIFFGRQIGMAINLSNRFSNCEIIIPLPLFKEREKKRGYNQAAIIATGISERLNIPVVNDAVFRLKKTETQTRKSRIKRWENMKSTFKVQDSTKIINKHVLLVDDVVTTGATLEACARELLTIPGLRISIACLAHTVSA